MNRLNSPTTQRMAAQLLRGGGGGVFVFSSFMSIFLSFFSKLLSDTARVFKYLLQGDQEVLQTACGTL